MDSEDEIAIVGAGCRFPGADNLDEFWKVLINGENHVKDIPETRWNNSAFYDEDQLAPGKIYAKKAGLLKNHDKWDNRLFGISEVEATRVDPQQRYVLECVHMALEDGGITRKQINGSNTGVIIGSMNDDYRVMANSDLSEVGGYNATGTASSVLAARVSYVYNLHGTCLTLDTACSSALIAIHLASQTIKAGDCDMMICGGVSSILSPDTFKALCEARMLSAIGQCQSFCDTADGYARGEGCGIVILKNLKTAIEDGNKIWATIKTGSNQDGSVAKPMTAPSSEQQVELLKHVYESHGFDPSDIQYIEAHGTGTPRGDPTEINALGTFFSTSRSTQSSPLLFGSVKSNIGHTESAAGIAGLIKVLLMLKHGKYVPSLHVKPDKSNVNKSIQLSEYNLDIITSVQDFPPNKNGERYACLNSFGFGGSNTHAIISRRGDVLIEKVRDVTDGIIPICISATDSDALRLNLETFKEDIFENGDSCKDIAYTSFYNRDRFTMSTLVFGHDTKELQEECDHSLSRIGEILPKKKLNKVFVFCGVGTTWNGMCQELMRENDVFSKTIDQIDMYLKPLTGWRMRDKFLADTNYEDPFLNHVAIFCVQVALSEVWKSFGIVPDAIVGQSVGEVAAAYAANLLTLEEAVKIIYIRSEILARQTGGSMTVVGNMDIKEVENICSKYQDKVCIAVYSSPVACTLSGNTTELSKLTESLKGDEHKNGVFVRHLKVKCAYHSPLLQACVDDIKNSIDKSLKNKMTDQEKEAKQNISMISTVSGQPVTSAEVETGSYWATNIRQPVRFMQSIKRSFDEESYNVYVEIGPRPVLRAHLSNIFKDSNKACTIPSMLPKEELKCLYRSLSEMFELGIDISCSTFTNLDRCQTTRLPRYTFNRTADLYIPQITKDYLAGYSIDNSHMFICTARGPDATKFEIRVDVKSTPFVFDHFLSEKVILPGATYIETGFHIGMELLKLPLEHTSVSFSFSKTFSPPAGRENKLSIQLTSQSTNEVQFSVINTGSILATGSVFTRSDCMRPQVNMNYLKSQCQNYKSKVECYASLETLNFRYGDSLSLIQEAWVSNTETKCLTKIHVPDNVRKECANTHFHPAIIDSVFQIFGILMKNDNVFVVPKGIDAVALNKPIEPVMFAYGEEVSATNSSTYYNAVLLSRDGSVIAEFENFHTKSVSSDRSLQDKTYAYELKWSEIGHFQNDNDRVQNHKIMLFSNDKDSEWLQDLQRQTGVIPERTHGKVSFTSNKRFSDYMTVVYHAGEMIESDEKFEANTPFEGAVKRFLILKKLLSALKSVDKNISFVVITENTQMCPNRQTMRYSGSELWGLLRSAALEGGIKDMKLIDIDRENVDITTLVRLVTSKEHDLEYALSGTIVYKPRLRNEIRHIRPKRTVRVAPSDELAVVSCRQTCIKDPFLLMSNKKTDMPNSTLIAVEALTIHNRDIYLQTVKDIDTGYVSLDKQKDDGYQLLAIEGRGVIQKSKRGVFFLYPVNAETIVDIPLEHIITEDECSVKLSGILILIDLLVHMAATIPNGTDITVMKYSKGTDIGMEMFMHMMETKQCLAQFLTVEEFNSGEVSFNTSVLIVTTTLSIQEWTTIAKSTITQIISLNLFVSDRLKAWLYHISPSLKLTILSTTELLSAACLKDAMPNIKECLQHFHSNAATIESNHFMLDLPMEELNVKTKINDGSLQCLYNEISVFRSQACYVIVGGLTGLGWELLHLMAEKGAEVIVTLSRRIPSNIVLEKIHNLQNRYHCHILTLQTDVTDLTSVQSSFSEIHQQFPNYPVKGIFHGAGILADSILENIDEEKVRTVMKPKICGAWNLHLASLNLPLDYFVLHSSIVSVIGNPGQCNYAAANSFIDSFALYRRSQGLPAQSINWGALAVGMAVDNDEIKMQLKRSGFNALSNEQMKNLFLEALAQGETGVVYADVEWDTLLSLNSMIEHSSKYSDFLTKTHANIQEKKLIFFDIEDSLKLDDIQLTEHIKCTLKMIIQEQLVVEENSLKDERSITDIGIDSMAAMSLSNRIDDVFKCRIPLVNLLSEGTSLSTITEYVRQQIHQVSCENRLENTQDGFDSQGLFSSETFSFMQIDFLEKYKKHRDDPYYLRVIDVELTDCKFRMDEWNVILRHVVKINPELRTKYFFSDTDNSVYVETNTEDIPDIELVKILDISNDIIHTQDVRLALSADIHGRLPTSFRVSENETSTIMRIITHALAMDMRGMSLLCRDIETTANAYLSKTDLPRRSYVDIPVAVKTHILPRMTEFANYWNTYLDRNITPVTLGGGPKLQAVDATYCEITYLDFRQETVSKIKKYISHLGISLYEFIMSLYQIYLFIGSNSPIITIGTAADMRPHVPELKDVITRCVNYLPIVAEIGDEITIDDFIRDNSRTLLATTLHGAYPNSLLLKRLKTEQIRENVFRHFLAMNDIGEINRITTMQSGKAAIRQVWHMRHNRETFMFVRYDLHNDWIKLEIGQNTKICGEYGAVFAENMKRLVEAAMSSSNKTIRTLRDELTPSRGDKNTVLSEEKIGPNETKEQQPICLPVPSKCANTEKSGIIPQIDDEQSQSAHHVVLRSNSNLNNRPRGVEILKPKPAKDELLARVDKTILKSSQVLQLLKYNKLNDKMMRLNTDSVITELGPSETVQRLNDGMVERKQVNDKNFIISGQFDKQTSHGWDHKVEVRLCVTDGRVMLEWGKEKRMRKNKPKVFDLTTSREVIMEELNGRPSLIFVADEKLLVLKTPDQQQAGKWFDAIQWTMGRP